MEIKENAIYINDDFLRNEIENLYTVNGNPDPYKVIDILQEDCAELIQTAAEYRRNRDSDDDVKEKIKKNIVKGLTNVAISSLHLANVLDIRQEQIDNEVNIKAESYDFPISCIQGIDHVRSLLARKKRLVKVGYKYENTQNPDSRENPGL